MGDSLERISTAAGDCLDSGNLERALELFTSAAAMATAQDKHEELSGLLGDLAVTYRRLGDVQAAIATNRRAIEVARACGHYLNVARWSGNLGGLLYHQGDVDAAENCFREATVAAAQTESTEQMSIAAGHVAGMMGERGRFSEAVDTMQEALALAVDAPDLTSIIRSQERALFLRWAFSLRQAGRLRQAREVIQRALSNGAHSPPSQDQVVMLTLLGEIEENEGDIVSACEAVQRAADVSELIGLEEDADRLRTLAQNMRG